MLETDFYRSDLFNGIMASSIFPSLAEVFTEAILSEENYTPCDFVYPRAMSEQMEGVRSLDERDFLNQQVLVAGSVDAVSSTVEEADIQELTQPDDLMIPLMWPNVYDGQGGETLVVEYEVEVSPEETEMIYANSPGSAGEDSEFSSEPENESSGNEEIPVLPPFKKVEVKTEPDMEVDKEKCYLPVPVQGMLSPYEEEELEDSYEIMNNNISKKKKQRKSDSEYLADGRRRPGRKKGQTSSVYHLWEFIRDLLHDPTQRIIKWENEQEGIFRVVKSSEVAKQWGNMKKNREKMTYEKLSRSLRYSRKEGYFEDVPKNEGYPKKLCFKFGPKSHGWKRS